MRKIRWTVLIISFVIVLFVASVGSLFTDTGSWYESRKPAITPPNYIFPIAWTTLFILIAISLYFSWINSKKKDKKRVALVFGANLFLNMLWSILFFGLKNPFIAFIDLILLWVSILIMIFTTWKIDKKAAWLLVPYLLWVSFAGILNYLMI